MPNTILICGYGPGISNAVARRFGKEGFSVALVARREPVLEQAVSDLARDGISAAAFATDVRNTNAVVGLVEKVRENVGAISVIHWNAYTAGGGDLLNASLDDIRQPFDTAVTGLVSAVQAALPDLKEQHGAVLVTGGALAFQDAAVDAFATKWKLASLAISKAAQHKLVGLLSQSLAPEGIYVGEVVVKGTVKGSAFDTGGGNLDADSIAEKFWKLYSQRTVVSVTYSG
jgi:NADP-dependent 3-hydroxy acid dehydrogenase YdfG